MDGTRFLVVSGWNHSHFERCASHIVVSTRARAYNGGMGVMESRTKPLVRGRALSKVKVRICLTNKYDFWATACNTVRPMLSGCPVYLSVCLSCL